MSQFKLIKTEQDFSLKNDVITSLSNPFYKKEDKNPYTQVGVSHNEVLAKTIPLLQENRKHEISIKNFKTEMESYFRNHSYWNKYPINILDGIIPICFPTGGPFGPMDNFPFGGGSFLLNNSGGFNIDSSTLPLLDEVYRFVDASLNTIDLTREDQLVKLIEEINRIEVQITKMKKVDTLDKNISFMALSVFENSILFWNKYGNDNEIMAKAGPGGPGRIASADFKGAIVGAVVGTFTGGPGVGTVVGSWASSTASSYLQTGIELFW
jgi:hypothetical protein